jgi:hypothetical protein
VPGLAKTRRLRRVDRDLVGADIFGVIDGVHEDLDPDGAIVLAPISAIHVLLGDITKGCPSLDFHGAISIIGDITGHVGSLCKVVRGTVGSLDQVQEVPPHP